MHIFIELNLTWYWIINDVFVSYLSCNCRYPIRRGNRSRKCACRLHSLSCGHPSTFSRNYRSLPLGTFLRRRELPILSSTLIEVLLPLSHHEVSRPVLGVQDNRRFCTLLHRGSKTRSYTKSTLCDGRPQNVPPKLHICIACFLSLSFWLQRVDRSLFPWLGDRFCAVPP